MSVGKMRNCVMHNKVKSPRQCLLCRLSLIRTDLYCQQYKKTLIGLIPAVRGGRRPTVWENIEQSTAHIRVHDRQLHEHQGHLSDCNFITRLLYINSYYLNNRLCVLQTLVFSKRQRITWRLLYAMSRPSVCLWRWCTLLRRLNFSAFFFTIR